MPRNLKSIFVYLLVSLSIISIAQLPETNPNINRTKNWFFGESAGLQFLSDTVISVTNYSLNANEGCAAYSNAEGEMVFYSNGINLKDSSNNAISINLKGYASSSQGILFESTPFKLLLLTTSPDSGYWVFKYDNSIFLHKKLLKVSSEAQTSVFHQNSRDKWISTHNLDSSFISFLSVSQDILCCPIISTVGAARDGSYPISSGVMKFNFNASQMYTSTWIGNTIEMYIFNYEEGTFKLNVTIPHSSASRLSISPNGNILYVVDGAEHIHQYDISLLDSASIVASKKLIATSDTKFGGMQLGSGGKIYVSTYKEQSLGVINKPIEVAI